MTLVEWLIQGGRKCECKDLKFKLGVTSFKKKKIRSIDPFRNLILNAAIGVSYNKVELKRYLARCSECDALYFVFERKKDLMQAIKETGIEIAQK